MLTLCLFNLKYECLDILVFAPRGKPPKKRVERAKLGVFERNISPSKLPFERLAKKQAMLVTCN